MSWRLWRRERFGFIFQRYNLLSSLTARDNVALPAVYMGMDSKERAERAEKLLGDLGLQNKEGNKPSELSGGQQQRVSIARALMNGGEIIFADEPTGALDTASGKNVMEIIHKLHEDGHTVIMVTHDPGIAANANRVIEIRDGQIISDTSKNPDIPPSKVERIKEKASWSFLLRPIYGSIQNVGTGDYGAQNAFITDHAGDYHRYCFGGIGGGLG